MGFSMDVKYIMSPACTLWWYSTAEFCSVQRYGTTWGFCGLHFDCKKAPYIFDVPVVPYSTEVMYDREAPLHFHCFLTIFRKPVYQDY